MNECLNVHADGWHCIRKEMNLYEQERTFTNDGSRTILWNRDYSMYCGGDYRIKRRNVFFWKDRIFKNPIFDFGNRIDCIRSCYLDECYLSGKDRSGDFK